MTGERQESDKGSHTWRTDGGDGSGPLALLMRAAEKFVIRRITFLEPGATLRNSGAGHMFVVRVCSNKVGCCGDEDGCEDGEGVHGGETTGGKRGKGRT